MGHVGEGLVAALAQAALAVEVGDDVLARVVALEDPVDLLRRLVVAEDLLQDLLALVGERDEGVARGSHLVPVGGVERLQDVVGKLRHLADLDVVEDRGVQVLALLGPLEDVADLLRHALRRAAVLLVRLRDRLMVGVRPVVELAPLGELVGEDLLVAPPGTSARSRG